MAMYASNPESGGGIYAQPVQSPIYAAQVVQQPVYVHQQPPQVVMSGNPVEQNQSYGEVRSQSSRGNMKINQEVNPKYAGMGGVACCLILVLLYVLWPADFGVEVDVPGIKVTAIVFPEAGKEADFQFNMQVPVLVTNDNWYDFNTEISLVAVADSSGGTNGIVEDTPIEEISKGRWSGLIEGTEMFTKTRPRRLVLNLTAAGTIMEGTNLHSTAVKNNIIKGLKKQCPTGNANLKNFNIQLQGWLNFTTTLKSDQDLDETDVELPCAAFAALGGQTSSALVVSAPAAGAVAAATFAAIAAGWY